MKSFGSTLDRAGGSLGSMFDSQSTGLWNTKKNNFLGKVSNAVSQSIGGAIAKGASSALGGAGITPSDRIEYNASRDTSIIYNDTAAVNISAENGIPASGTISKAVDTLNKTGSEDTSKWDQSVIDEMNWYNFSAGTALNIYDSYTENGGSVYRMADAQKVVHSLFNPYYGIDPSFGMGPNQFIAAQQSVSMKEADDPSDCTISKLVKLSRRKSSTLGQARYKYADFMFCKELGMPNNHLITLRRYAAPVGDRIHGGAVVSTETTQAKYWNNNVIPSDIGHLCCYFGGEDNKLEDILKYSFKQTYKTMNSEFQMVSSQEDDKESPLGRIVNSASANYNKHMAIGDTGSNNIITWGAAKIGGPAKYFFGNTGWYGANSALYYRDKNKIYEPKNTIQEVEYYEGKLQFSHEFTIVFSYKLRSYDNISPKMAMLDLLANITRTCYSRGNFWGGRRQLNGPQPNASGWNKANAFIDNTWDKLGSGLSAIMDGNFDFTGFLGSVTGLASKAMEQVKNAISSITQEGGVKKAATGLGELLKTVNKKTGFTDGLKGALKNTLGRPQLYAVDSLLTGGNTGVWHLTIGNPLKPIVTIGNLIVTNTEIQHKGPLGIDDFPTELKVTVSFKHARPRDAVDIEKMYMFGDKSIYKTHVRTEPSKIYTIFGNSSNNDAKADAEKYVDNAPSNARNTDMQTEAADARAQNNDIKQPAATASNNEETEVSGLDYIGEFDTARMRANMNELA